MSFFSRQGHSEGDAEHAESLERIEAGGIPLPAEQRLRELSVEGAMFTSGLSVKEFALLDALGPIPLAQVMGASVVRTGWQYLPALPPGEVRTGSLGYRGNPMGPYQTTLNRVTEPSAQVIRSYMWHASVVCELEVLSDAWNLARRRALDRLAEEALQVGADAVVGVRVRRGDHDVARGSIEYVVMGTAVRLPGADHAAWPVITDLSVQDYWRLHEAGYEPAGFLSTTAVTFASPPLSTRLARRRALTENLEMTELTEAFHAARETVRARLRGQVSDAHGTGAVGVELTHEVRQEKFYLASSLASTSRQGWHLGRLGIPYYVSGHSDTERKGWMITMHAAGTAIRRRSSSRDSRQATELKVGMR